MQSAHNQDRVPENPAFSAREQATLRRHADADIAKLGGDIAYQFPLLAFISVGLTRYRTDYPLFSILFVITMAAMALWRFRLMQGFATRYAQDTRRWVQDNSVAIWINLGLWSTFIAFSQLHYGVQSREGAMALIYATGMAGFALTTLNPRYYLLLGALLILLVPQIAVSVYLAVHTGTGISMPVMYSVFLAVLLRKSRQITANYQRALYNRGLLEKRATSLAEAQRHAQELIRAKTRFLANMSHEIRTPLNSVIGTTQLLLDCQLAETPKRLAAQAEAASQHLLTLVNEVLDFSKLESTTARLQLEPCNIADEVRQAVSILESQALGKGLTVDAHIDPNTEKWYRADPTRLRQILSNLLGNAIKFTHRGFIRVELRALPPEIGQGDVSRLHFSVQDSGIGVAAEAQTILFDEFSQADASTTREYGGTGLGLAICRKLVTLMGGTIGMKSAPGSGSIFWFEVPFEATANPAPVARCEDEHSSAVGPLRVLVADDNVFNQDLMKAVLESLGHQPIVASDGAKALAYMQCRDCDLIFMDLHMPVMDGLDACRSIRRLDGPAAKVPIIALTADVDPTTRAAVLEAGMDEMLTKPIDLQRIREVLAKVPAYRPDR